MDQRITGRAYVLGDNIDTDQIIPAQYLSFNPSLPEERKFFGMYAMSSVPEGQRGLPQGNVPFVRENEFKSDFRIVIGGKNFGSGSSREHAVWAIQDHGFGAVIAPSFADIFKNNSTKNGLLAIDLPKETVEDLLEAVREDPETVITIELDELTVTAPNVYETFEMDDFTRQRIMQGLDDISLTLTHEDDLEAFERSRPAYLPSVQ